MRSRYYRIAAAHTLPREVRAHQEYQFEAARLRALATPTLLLLGGDSPPIFRAATDALAAVLPVHHTMMLPGQQHAAMDTAPELFAREVIAFLTEPVI